MAAGWLLWSLSAGTAGCQHQPAEPVRFPVSGQILLDGKPLAEAFVFFHPLTPGGTLPRPLGITAADGTYHLTTLTPNDGATPGQYAITVELREVRTDGDEPIRDGRQLLPEKYRNPQTSGWQFEVRPTPNEVPPLQLRSR